MHYYIHNKSNKPCKLPIKKGVKGFLPPVPPREFRILGKLELDMINFEALKPLESHGVIEVLTTVPCYKMES